MALGGAKPKEDRTQVRHRNPVAEWTEVDNVPFDGPPLPPRAGASESAWAEAGVIPSANWPAMTERWWEVIRQMPHAKLWTPGDWEFAAMTAEIHARTAEGWRGYAGGELRQREKLMGTYADARRDLRIKYVEPQAENQNAVPAGVANIADYRSL